MLQGGHVPFDYWGLRLCSTCGKGVLDVGVPIAPSLNQERDCFVMKKSVVVKMIMNKTMMIMNDEQDWLKG